MDGTHWNKRPLEIPSINSWLQMEIWVARHYPEVQEWGCYAWGQSAFEKRNVILHAANGIRMASIHQANIEQAL